MPALRFAAATRHFAQPIRQSIDTAASIGATGVQLDVRNELKPTELSETGRRHLIRQLGEQRLELASFEYPTRRAFHDSAQLDARIAGLKGALEFAYSMGVTVVVGRVGRIPDDPELPAYKVLCEVLNDIARHSNKVGATFAITPSSDSSEALRGLFERVTDGPIGLNLDPAGLIMSNGDPVETYRTLYDRVLSVQIRDGLRDVDGQGVEVPLGRGEVVWDELLAMLEEGAFRGWLVATRSSGDDKVGDMARAIRYIRTVAAGE
jgi:sugar phosphate isomerase/epimerase